jgi:hypothetical protein
LEEAVFSAVVDFLHSPQGFESEVQRRKGITAETTESLHREFESLKRQLEEEQAAEARAFRLAARTQVSEAVFNQEVGLIRTRQRWIGEQIQRVQAQLEDIERYSFSEEAIALLRHRLEARLAGSTPEDQRFVLEAVGARVIVQADRSWELEMQIPRSASEPDDALQIVNTRPGSDSPG